MLIAFYDEQEKRLRKAIRNIKMGNLCSWAMRLIYLALCSMFFVWHWILKRELFSHFECFGCAKSGISGKKLCEEIFNDVLKKATGFFSVVI